MGGVLSATALGTALWWATPFTPLQSAGMSFTICILGFAGGLVMSAIKRDIGIKDFGVVIEGHGGILDRIDSLCFAAPIFFHLVRYYVCAVEFPALSARSLFHCRLVPMPCRDFRNPRAANIPR